MTVALYFTLGILYLFFSGYGLTGLFLREDPDRILLVLLNGFCLTMVVFSESILLFHAADSAFLAAIISAFFINLIFLLTKRDVVFRRAPLLKSNHARRMRAARWTVFALATGIVIFVTWSFFISGWRSYWGSANEDIFDALNGRDAYLKGEALDVGRFLDPLTRYQYSSLAFWSLLFRSFGGMNVFYLQGQIMIFLQVLGIYYLAKRGLRLSHKSALLASFLGSCGAFYISTFFTGHEGSLVFAAIIPFLLGLGLSSLQSGSVSWRQLAVAGLWLFVILHTYVFPLGFSVIPFVFFAFYRTILCNDARRTYVKLAAKRVFTLPAESKPRLLRLAMISFCFLLGAAALAGIAGRVWFVMEPVRMRAMTVFRAWGVSHYKEMLLIYWGFLPSSIPFGSIANPAKLDVPTLMITGYIGAAALIAAALHGIRSILRTPRAPAAFLVFFMGCWFATFLIMKFVVVDSYYLYKFYYTNYYIGAIVLIIAFRTIFEPTGKTHSMPASRMARVPIGILAAGFVGLNLLYITLYNIDIASRPYNQSSSRLADISPLREYVKAGVSFNVPKFDNQNLLLYLFRHNGFPIPDAVSQFFEYELEIVGVDDIVYHQPGDRTLVWDNGTYRLYKSKAADKLRFDTYYQGERYPDIYNNNPFRWVKDRVALDIIDPAPGNHSLTLCVEPGPGLNYRPFWLYEYLNGKLFDSTLVTGVQSALIGLPYLSERVNEIKILVVEKGRNFLPWEERFLNYRVSLIGATQNQYLPQTLRILNSPNDVVPPRGCEIISDTSNSFEDLADVLLIGNNWSPVEYENDHPLRWAYNDGQLLLFNPGVSSRLLNITLELGPALGGQKTKMMFSVNGALVDSLILEGRHTLKIALPQKLQKENVISLHVVRTGRPVGPDPRILDFRLLKAFLSRE